MVVHWTTSDEAALIDFLVEHKAEAGNGFTVGSKSVAMFGSFGLLVM
jgi:hypothetical protein